MPRQFRREAYDDCDTEDDEERDHFEQQDANSFGREKQPSGPVDYEHEYDDLGTVSLSWPRQYRLWYPDTGMLSPTRTPLYRTSQAKTSWGETTPRGVTEAMRKQRQPSCSLTFEEALTAGLRTWSL